ncbi:MAG TPA: hypothetical protein VFM09_07620 [Marmoricola sp.]|nr:hypothetical protein [Marmoricola sp.]
MAEGATDGDRYEVVLLIEQALSALDARQVRSLHEEIDEPVRYHVLLPVEDAAMRVETAMGSLAGGEILASPAMVMAQADREDLEEELEQSCRRDLQSSVDALVRAGAEADGDTVAADPIEALAAKVREVDGREAIILTRPHVVQEFFHLDWTSRARRKLGVPVLHLLEHETFDEQAEGFGEEGVTGL